jgi:cholesterol transport system auxiliary component
MTRVQGLLRLCLGLALAASLAGCISLLPKTKPAQLYRFTPPGPATSTASPGDNAVGVFESGGEFQQESAGDRLLTVTGPRVAYIADARWAAPAQVLFNQAMDTAFESSGGHVRLTPRGAPSATDYVLRVDVRKFEARYEAGPKAAPTVLVRIHALMTRDRNHTLVSEQVFEARVPASDNRVSAIVAAFARATDQVLKQLVAWTNQKAA